MTEAFRQVALLLPQLSQMELDQVQQRLNMLRNSPSANPSGDNSISDDWVLQSISHTMARLGGCGPQKCSSQDLVNFKSKLPAILTFLKQAGSRRVQQQRLLSIAVELLYQDLGQQNIPASLVTVIRHIHRLPAVMDRNFPQYAMNGLLGLLVNGEPHVRQE